MVNRREVLVGAAAVACASIGGAVSAAVPGHVADIVLYGAGPSGEPRDVSMFLPPGSEAGRYMIFAQDGLRYCERHGIRPLGFVLNDRAFVNLWLDYLKLLDRYSWPKPVSYTLLGYPVVVVDAAGGVLESPVIENDNKDLAFFFGE